MKRTDAAYWRILDFRFLAGRPFTSDEEQRGALVAVISDSLARKLFDKRQALDQSIEIDGRNFRVIGVVPAVPITRFAAWADVWVPHTTSRSSDYRHQFMGNYNGIVLARTKNDLPRLKNEFAARVKRMPISDPKIFNKIDTALETPLETFARGMLPGRTPGNHKLIMEIIITCGVLLFMSLPALNLITLNLSRILERASEIGVRKAFGASRGALVSQFVFENVVLTLIGGVVSLAAAAGLIAWLNYSELIPHAHFELNFRVLLYGILLAAFFGIFSGVYPAWRMSRLQAVNALRGGAQ
jgi:putative ABC transport system permease protein